MAEAILVFVVRRGALGVRCIRGQNAFAFVGMQPLLPFFDAVCDFMIFIAEDALPARGEVDIPGPQIPIPETVLGAAHG